MTWSMLAVHLKCKFYETMDKLSVVFSILFPLPSAVLALRKYSIGWITVASKWSTAPSNALYIFRIMAPAHAREHTYTHTHTHTVSSKNRNSLLFVSQIAERKQYILDSMSWISVKILFLPFQQLHSSLLSTISNGHWDSSEWYKDNSPSFQGFPLKCNKTASGPIQGKGAVGGPLRG